MGRGFGGIGEMFACKINRSVWLLQRAIDAGFLFGCPTSPTALAVFGVRPCHTDAIAHHLLVAWMQAFTGNERRLQTFTDTET